MRERALFVLLWVYGSALAYVADAALAAQLGQSPVSHNPLRPTELSLVLNLVGWLGWGFFLPASLVASRAWTRVSDLAPVLLSLSPLMGGLGLAFLWCREWDGAPAICGLATLGLIALPLVERRGAKPGWWQPWAASLALVLYFVVNDPAHGIARAHFPHRVGWWIGVTACGAALTRQLWVRGLPGTSTLNAAFWSCAVWSLVANSLEVSKFSVGLMSVVWRSSGCYLRNAPPESYETPLGVFAHSLPGLLVLVTALWLLPRIWAGW